MHTKKVFYYVNSQGTKYYLNTKKFVIDGEEDNYFFFTEEVRHTACELRDNVGIKEDENFLPILKFNSKLECKDCGNIVEKVDDFYIKYLEE